MEWTKRQVFSSHNNEKNTYKVASLLKFVYKTRISKDLLQTKLIVHTSNLQAALLIIPIINVLVQIYNPDYFLVSVVGFFFVCQQIAFCSFVLFCTWLCLYFRRYRLIFKDLIDGRHRVPNPWVELHIITCAPSILLLQKFFLIVCSL